MVHVSLTIHNDNGVKCMSFDSETESQALSVCRNYKRLYNGDNRTHAELTSWCRTLKYI